MHRIARIVTVSLAGPASALAHHGIANFDLNADIELEGVVTSVEFLNPHSWLYLDVRNADGSITAWRCELRGATVLRRSGWTTEMFPSGIAVRISGSPDRREPNTCYLGTVYFPDGSSIDRYGQLTEPPDFSSIERAPRLANGNPNIDGDWAGEQRVMTDPRGQSGTLVPISVADQFEPGGVPQGGGAFPGARGTAISMADDPVDAFWNRRPSILPLTEAGAAVMADFDGASTDNPRLRCEPTNILFDWTFETDINRIEQSASTIVMHYGSMGIVRTIHLDMDSHPEGVEPSLAGHSIGRWEDDTLIVDTVGFLPGILAADGRLPHSGELHVVERFTLDPDTLALRRTYTAEDPTYFEGTYEGGDVVYPSELPYHGTTQCEDKTYRDPAPDNVSVDARSTDAAEQERDAPWWMFWSGWFD